MKFIRLGNGVYAQVDNDNYAWFRQFEWFMLPGGYAARKEILPDGTIKVLLMHRLVLLAPPGKQVDHINGDRLDNQRHNLRLCTPSQNQYNRRVKKVGLTSRYKGVHWNVKDQRWRAVITAEHQTHYLGGFTSEKTAALVYNEAAVRLHGSFARLNIVDS